MTDTKWLAGAFSAYGLTGNLGKQRRPSLFTSCQGGTEFIDEFFKRAEVGRVQPYKGAWQWVCDDASEVQQFYKAVGPHLIPGKRRAIEVSWEMWRDYRMTQANRKTGELPPDPGPITGPLYPTLIAEEIEYEEQANKRRRLYNE